jgi:hypothetical protein
MAFENSLRTLNALAVLLITLTLAAPRYFVYMTVIVEKLHGTKTLIDASRNAPAKLNPTSKRKSYGIFHLQEPTNRIHTNGYAD